MTEHDLILKKRWNIASCDEAKAKQLQQSLRIHPALCKLLVQRGVETFDEAKKFFRPSKEHLYDPYLMKGMKEAVERIDQAISKEEEILVYGDYDVDGTTSVALVHTFLKDFYTKTDYYIPNRYLEGYGISKQGIDFAAEEGFSLVIALDCGIKSVELIDYAASKGIDFIICDHHLPGDVVPAAAAVLDPKQDGCDYPYKELSGCGIGFKLMQALCRHLTIPEDKLFNLIDLVAVSIASDLVPITDENRTLAALGLNKLNENPLPGLKALTEVSNLRGKLTISDVVFYLGPRINAAGRMDDAKKAVRLLISGEMDGKQHATVLHDHNTERKGLDKEITEEALAILNADAAEKQRKTTVIMQPHWHKGVIGIVASRLIEKFYRPTIVLAESDGMLSGSARSVKGFNIYEAIKECADLLEKYGGHMYAAGLTLKKENYQAFRERFEAAVAATITPEQLIPEVAIDLELDFDHVKGPFYKILNQFAPFGPGNMKPIFISNKVTACGECRVVGEKHLKMQLRTGSSQKFNAIAFDFGHMAELLNGKPFKMCYTIEKNSYQGYSSIEFSVKDIKV